MSLVKKIFVIFLLLNFHLGVNAESIRVISYNIGASIHGKEFNIINCDGLKCDSDQGKLLSLNSSFSSIEKFLQKNRYNQSKQLNVFSLQEVDNDIARTGLINQATEIAKYLNSVEQGTQWYGQHTKATTIDGGDYGLGFISNHSLKNSYKINLNCFNDTYKDREQRIANILPVKLKNQITMYIINVHLSYTEHRAICQLKTLISYIKKNIPSTLPLMIMGDFNIIKGSKEYWMLKSIIAKHKFIELNNWLGVTFNSWGSKNRIIDYVLLRDINHMVTVENFSIKNPSTLTNDLRQFASDHKPIVIDVEINSKHIANSLYPAVSSLF